ncbi:hypothetical protein [Deinococcus radiotolerans]|uniref:Uncharacterized protein n=1 Tax=Deinococcus radiotolerans TaxID=1309407 RepID=A0ABQ2FND5_9DEIO|nr:hypothetical protein [Deinococcus radiotolerans]GGL11013.1 hypothetical protein GCM10010844_32150 [Deinococcus radiotolerans]
MRSLVLIAALTCSVAGAAPLLGTTSSFAESAFCRSYACRLAGKDVLGPKLTEWRYFVGPQNDDDSPIRVVSVIRQNDRVVSANWVTGAQDAVLYPGGFDTRMIAVLVGTLTGKTPTPGNLLDFEDACVANGSKVYTQTWTANSHLSCLITGEFRGALRYSFHVHLPQ